MLVVVGVVLLVLLAVLAVQEAVVLAHLILEELLELRILEVAAVLLEIPHKLVVLVVLES
jgi:hypothetical protein